MRDELIKRLKPKERRGSKPRCHLFTHGTPAEIASRLSVLVAPFGSVSPNHSWMPQGFDNPEEAQLHKAPRLLKTEQCAELGRWWLAPASAHARTPNFDIAATCEIRGKSGLILIEAKAHDEELFKEASGRRLQLVVSDDENADKGAYRRASHELIGGAIAEAREGLAKATGLPWNVSRDHHYQMSNRFAWAWKLTTLGVPVILIYLGFVGANEMSDQGNSIRDHGHWERLVISHSASLFPVEVWGKEWLLNGQSFIPLIRSVVQQI